MAARKLNPPESGQSVWPDCRLQGRGGLPIGGDVRKQLKELTGLEVWGPFACGARQEEVPADVIVKGVYVICDEHGQVAYVGMVRKSPHETTNPNSTGLWGRVRGHDDSQAKSDPVAFIVAKEMLLTPPPTINTPEDVHVLRRQVIAAARAKFRQMSWFGIPTHTADEAAKLEEKLRHRLAPYMNPLNNKED